MSRTRKTPTTETTPPARVKTVNKVLSKEELINQCNATNSTSSLANKNRTPKMNKNTQSMSAPSMLLSSESPSA